ncbi:Indoleamine 2,3-dioxygenase [Metschnikowia bicuspidata var. bicuspidata NRRL YB-4993]|uniref:Indoleamine 2,3-dioxygenase n=1 Tax=Metschnikowia bicuspidata var. bicuspidata NRRL YB-4993 TaxID=869754 RepID=A0A1A0H5J3_9ASCO|nr:Indoleamine 2,3-dioxygenase [Metschnikowia bicuspidata var. bicuspidata NRRL YB-4993]OBA19215.1 Indoleamine 2,3-dioxygenase [Metschnikowia bicuspidata var. bicuspidata NRRL YB-4993]
MLDILSFDVSEKTGFLPSEFPVTCLPQAYYKPWEDLVANLPALLLTKRVRGLVDKMPVLSPDHLENVPQIRRAYQVLGFLAHAYVWGTSEPSSRIPEQIAAPLVHVSETLGLPPLATYATLCLWNYKEIFPTPAGEEDQEMDLDNIATINTFTGAMDESWFYLVSVFFEYKGGRAIKFGKQALEHAENGNIPALTTSLQNLALAIDHLGSVLMQMEEMCDPHVFYFRIRPFLAGWKNMADVGLNKDGVLYGNETSPRAYAGGSNAQSTLIQFLDSLLSINHHSTGERPAPHSESKAEPAKAANSYLMEMRNYMPRKHREFLEAIDSGSKIRQTVSAHPDNGELSLSYDACLAMTKLFRDKHIQIVTRYVVLQAKKAPKLGSLLTMRSGLAKKKLNDGEEKGTGGTSLLPFLKQCRDETGDPAAGNWGKRILSDGVMRLNYSKPNGLNED